MKRASRASWSSFVPPWLAGMGVELTGVRFFAVSSWNRGKSCMGV